MSIFHRQAPMLIPFSWQAAPLMPHAFIINDRVYAIYQEPARNYNAYYQPAYERKAAIRIMSQRTPIYRQAKRHLPVAATVHHLSQLKMQRHLDAIKASRNRL